MRRMNVKLIESEISLLKDLSSPPPPPPPPNSSLSSPSLAPPNSSPLSTNLSRADHDTLQMLDEHYEHALEEGYVSYCARETCIFRNALVSVVAFVVFIALGTTVFNYNSHMPIVESILFTMVTWTTTGYDNKLHRTNFLMVFLIFYLYVGIATLTIFVTEVYQYVALVAARSRYDYKKEYLALIFYQQQQEEDEHGIGGTNSTAATPYQMLDTTKHGGGSSANHHRTSITSRTTMPFIIALSNPRNKHLKRIIQFFQENPTGQLFRSLLPCIFILLFSGAIFNITEDWSYLEGLYFSTVSLTTCGYGDFVPTNLSTKWICIFWLPLSVPFMGWYMSGIARFFLSVNERNIQKYEKRIRDRLRNMRHDTTNSSPTCKSTTVSDPKMVEMTLQKESLLGNHPHDLVLNVEHGSSTTTTYHHHHHPTSTTNNATTTTTLDSNSNIQQYKPESMKTMKHVLDAVRHKLALTTAAIFQDNDKTRNHNPSPVAQYFSLRAAKQISAEEAGKPSFILRTLVLERLGNIIANDVAGSKSTTDTNENTITVTFHTLKDVAIKWMIPTTAHKSFYSVCTHCLFFVGVHTMEVRKADALFELTSYDFHVLLGPFLADMGSSEDMENWLKATNILAKEIFIGIDMEEAIRRKQRRSSAEALTTSISNSSLV